MSTSGLLDRYRILAAYNDWANCRLYAAAARLSTEQYRADRGAFFKSVHGTLNHVLVGDQLWMRRFTGEGPAPASLDTILFETLNGLEPARRAEDKRILDFAAKLTDAGIVAEFTYTNSSGGRFMQPLWSGLDHFFNHQTHHRGQVHALISGFLGNVATPSLDLIYFLRESGLGGMRAAPPLS